MWHEQRAMAQGTLRPPAPAQPTTQPQEQLQQQSLQSLYDPSTFEGALWGTSGLVAPVGGSNWGMGGGRGAAMTLDDYYRMQDTEIDLSNSYDEGDATRYVMDEEGGYALDEEGDRVRYQPEASNLVGGITQEQRDAAMAFSNLYPNHVQLTKDQVQWQNGQLGIKGAGPSVGQYIENPDLIKFDPRYGYITPIGNDAVAGGKGGHRDFWKLASIFAAPFVGPAIGTAMGATGAGAAALGGGTFVGGTQLAGGASLSDSIKAGLKSGVLSYGMNSIMQPVDSFPAGATDMGGNAFNQGSLDNSFYDLANSNLGQALQPAKDAYGMYKKGTETIGALKSLFGSKDNFSSSNNGSNNFRESNSAPTLGSIYNTGTLNPNPDPYGLARNDRRRASRGR
jgi:hypothetical protein